MIQHREADSGQDSVIYLQLKKMGQQFEGKEMDQKEIQNTKKSKRFPRLRRSNSFQHLPDDYTTFHAWP